METSTALIVTSQEILSLDGKMVRTLMNARLMAGDHSLVWDGRRDDDGATEPGIYTIRITLENEVLSQKMVRMN